jgi:hypothetical protein
VKGAVPVAATLKVLEFPLLMETLAGCVVMNTGWFSDTRAEELMTLPTGLVTTTS